MFWLLTFSSISTLFFGAGALADLRLANALAPAFFPWVDFFAFPAIFSFEQFFYFLSYHVFYFFKKFKSSNWIWISWNVMSLRIGIELWLVDEKSSRRMRAGFISSDSSEWLIRRTSRWGHGESATSNSAFRYLLHCRSALRYRAICSSSSFWDRG